MTQGGSVILHCNFEELRALAAASELVLAQAGDREGAAAVPAEERLRVEQLEPLLVGDLSIESLAQQRSLAAAVRFLSSELLRRLDARVVDAGPAAEDAVNLYFDYGHVRAVLHRLDSMGAEMEAIAELISGGNPAASGGVSFPD
jgi:hypothetical protein